MIQIISEVLNNEVKFSEYNKNHHANAYELLPSAREKSYAEMVDEDDAVFLSIKLLFGDAATPKISKLIEEKNFMEALTYVNRTLRRHRDMFITLSISCTSDVAAITADAGLIVNALIQMIDTDEGEQSFPDYIKQMLIQEIENTIEEKKDTPNTPPIPGKLTDKRGNNSGDSRGGSANEKLSEPNNKMNERSRIKDEYAGFDENAGDRKILGGEIQHTKQGNESRYIGQGHDEIAQTTQKNEASIKVSKSALEYFSSNGMDYVNQNRKIDETRENACRPQYDGAARKENSGFTARFGSGKTIDYTDLIKAASQSGNNDVAHNIDTDNVESVTKREEQAETTKEAKVIAETRIAAREKPHLTQEEAYQRATPETPFLNLLDEYVPVSDIEALLEPSPIYEIEEEDASFPTTMSKTQIAENFAQVIRYFSESEHSMMVRVIKGEESQDKFMNEIIAYINRIMHVPSEDMNFFLNKVARAFFSYYVLTAAINDPNVSDIRVLAPDNINVKVRGKHYTASGLKFVDANDYFRFIEILLIRNNVPFGGVPIKVFTDKDFHEDYILRFNVCMPSINTTEMPYLHIRKVAKDKMSLDKLMVAGMLDTKLRAYLLDKVINSKGIVFAGPSASGKTTLMNALLDYIPKDKSILCIQESEELFSYEHPNAYFQHMLKDDRGNVIIGLSELGQNGLLCDSGYFIISECKGAEVRDLLRASNTGHKCWCSVHTQNTRETIPRLADYVKYGSSYSFTEAIRMLKDLEVIVYIQDFKITEISEIIGYDDDNEKIIYRAIYKR